MDLLERFSKIFTLIALVILIGDIPQYLWAKTSQKTVINDIVDIKDFKKLLRTKNNVLVLFMNSVKQSSQIMKVFEETAEFIKGQGTMVLTDCSGDAKKLCKKLKVTPEPYILKHYKDGEFHKNYDRKETVSSMLNFMKDPTGDIPWDEDSSTADIVHIPDPSSLSKFLKKELGRVMVMFYAPWCGFCKQLKPEYSAAALELKGHSILAAIDVNRPENAVIRSRYNITGFPTLIYFENGVKKFNYEGENNKKSLVEFMKNPTATPTKPHDIEWSAVENEVKHLTDDTFDDYIRKTDNVLVMFYAPWCGHCKNLKPHYERAADTIKIHKINGNLAALDATREKKTAKKFSVTAYPTLKFFKHGEFQFDLKLREEKELVDFMKNPIKPPPPPPPEIPWSEEESEVVHLTVETFKNFLKKKKHVLVMFYAPWCGHCKKAKPEFSASAEFFKDDPKIEFAAVDCTAQSSVCSAYDVKGYPTIKIFHYYNREPVEDYTGGRTKQDFVNFMMKFAYQREPESTSPTPKTSKTMVKPGSTAPHAEDTWNKHRNIEEARDKQRHADDWDKRRNAVDGWDKLRNADDTWDKHRNADLIIHLKDSDFDKTLSNYHSVLVLFYEKGCKHCDKIKEAFSDAALMVENSKMSTKLAAYNAAKYNKIVKERRITDFPSVQFYKKGVFVKTYTGKFEASEFFYFVKNLHGYKSRRDEL